MAQVKREAAGTALITGASSGIGRDYARYLAARGYDLVITARRAARLNALAKELEKGFDTKVTVIVADMAKPETPTKLAAEVKKKKIQIDYLVNNAGYGVAAKFDKSKWQMQQDMIQVMLTGLTELAHLFGAEMVKRGHGSIVNVASVAAYLPGTPGNTLYAPIKAYVKVFSQSLYREMRPMGVNVVALCPGFTHSEIHDVAGARSAVNRIPGFMWLDGPRVVRDAHVAVIQGKGPVVINGGIYSLLASIVSTLPDNLITLAGSKKLKKAEKPKAPTKSKAASKTKKAPAKKPATKKAAPKKTAAKKPAAKKTAATKPARKAAKK